MSRTTPKKTHWHNQKIRCTEINSISKIGLKRKCNKRAKYFINGKNLCKKHFKELGGKK
jgi:hypothetical protein